MIVTDGPSEFKAWIKVVDKLLFTIPATQTSISKGQWIEYLPISNITDSGPIEFYVSGTGDEYLDLARTQLFVKAKITKANGTAIDADTQVGPVNLLLHSLCTRKRDVCVTPSLIVFQRLADREFYFA